MKREPFLKRKPYSEKVLELVGDTKEVRKALLNGCIHGDYSEVKLAIEGHIIGVQQDYNYKRETTPNSKIFAGKLEHIRQLDLAQRLMEETKLLENYTQGMLRENYGHPQLTEMLLKADKTGDYSAIFEAHDGRIQMKQAMKAPSYVERKPEKTFVDKVSCLLNNFLGTGRV